MKMERSGKRFWFTVYSGKVLSTGKAGLLGEAEGVVGFGWSGLLWLFVFIVFVTRYYWTF